jgi:hypothetical protein
MVIKITSSKEILPNVIKITSGRSSKIFKTNK